MVLPLRTFGPVKKIFLAIVDSSKSFKRTSPFSLYLNNDAVIDFVPFLKSCTKNWYILLQVMISHFCNQYITSRLFQFLTLIVVYILILSNFLFTRKSKISVLCVVLTFCSGQHLLYLTPKYLYKL